MKFPLPDRGICSDPEHSGEIAERLRVLTVQIK
jgi:hypothetical protein